MNSKVFGQSANSTGQPGPMINQLQLLLDCNSRGSCVCSGFASASACVSVSVSNGSWANKDEFSLESNERFKCSLTPWMTSNK